ncbi:uncharacterized protein LOC143026514 [Oratosquilla oratoria]|uniref:uncharacterized protein LOC143026514 n=1 Tax=Oratosquilla oratoria TaxID=337810 RepID=UPI003F7661FA
MLQLCNVILNALLVLFAAVFFIRHVAYHKEDLASMFSGGQCNDCIDIYFAGPPKIDDADFLDLIKEKLVVDPPINPDTEPIDIYFPVWRKLLDWYKVQEQFKSIWENQPKGQFLEVGAVDGEFMSQTLYLEKNLNWTGYLIEPDPRSFEMLRHSGRNATLIKACVAHARPSQRKLWIRSLDEDLPFHFKQLLMARSKLNDETLLGDEERGTITWVNCFPLSQILNAVQVTSLDLLTIATGTEGDNERIADVTKSTNLDIKTLLIHYPTIHLFKDPYPAIPNYILDMSHSTLLIKFYVKKTECMLIEDNNCKDMAYYDIVKSCTHYSCFGYLDVWAP